MGKKSKSHQVLHQFILLGMWDWCVSWHFESVKVKGRSDQELCFLLLALSMLQSGNINMIGSVLPWVWSQGLKWREGSRCHMHKLSEGGIDNSHCAAENPENA